jgi:Putative MetA-pathway of phenol degradation
VHCATKSLDAQLPFYTDDPAVTERRQWHFEVFNEFDALHYDQYPNLQQNTLNCKLNYGLPHNLEVDLEGPYLGILRALGTESSSGIGDAGVGLKWNFYRESSRSRLPALGASFYIEFPTGDRRQELGSGLTDYWLNFMTQKSLTDKTRINGNIGFVFAGNTSTGVLGVQTTRGHVYTAGFSLLHDVGDRLTLGGEIDGGISDDRSLDRDQLQGMLGGWYSIRSGITLNFGLLLGKYTASPRIGGQLGFSVNLPDVLHQSTSHETFAH